VFARWSILGLVPLLGGYNLVQSSVSLWVLLVRRQNALLAITIIATSASAMLEVFGVFAGGIKIGPFYMEDIGLAFLLSEIALLLLLGQRAMEAWRAREELRVEFDAAREVQQQLVAPAVDLPGFKIQSAYAPYRNGVEMTVEPGLPLGLVAEASYAETRYTIAAGDRLTFVSDGVLEASNAKGELFGFERTQSISAESANQIAKAAELFGQEDDITVLTLTRENIGASASTPISVPALSV
jgi:hypothetical protein